MTGVELIAAERRRQIDGVGYDAAHDRGAYDDLALAGATYALPIWERDTLRSQTGRTFGEHLWPWRRHSWKPTPDDRVRELVKAGALIAAAIDALQEERA